MLVCVCVELVFGTHKAMLEHRMDREHFVKATNISSAFHLPEQSAREDGSETARVRVRYVIPDPGLGVVKMFVHAEAAGS